MVTNLIRARHGGKKGIGGPDAPTLIIGEKEGSILNNWPSERASELIALESGDGCGGAVEIVLGIHKRVAKKLERASVKTVAAGFGRDVDHRTTFSNVGAEVIGLNFKFLNRIDRRFDQFETDLLFVVVEPV